MKYKYLKIFLALVLIISLVFTSIYLYLPGEINIIEGQNNLFKLQLPIHAKINSDKKGVLIVNDKKVNKDNIKVDLRQGINLKLLDNNDVDIDFRVLGLNVKNVKVDVLPNQSLIPCGNIVGVRIFTEGVMILGTGFVNGVDGRIYEPSRGILRSGDLIIKVGNNNINSKEDLVRSIEDAKSSQVNVTIKRKNKVLDKVVDLIKCSDDNKYKMGIWVRDSTQGIGTLTYYNPSNMNFGALGHGILDVDTNNLIEIEDGKIIRTNISYIKKGEKGLPGEIAGIIGDVSRNELGKVKRNTEYGIFGKLNSNRIRELKQKPLPIGLKDEIKLGDAYIYSNILGSEVKKFKVKIESINKMAYDSNKGMIIKIVDKSLLEETNGIIQGMSGSPIVQNGKLIGAVTHVFVNDPTKGYGIFIESMLKKEKGL